ncbi:bifunctional folylpolyglutamate synthase/dihydrofolate synthase [Lapidilactobacillus salsurivasis]
MTTITDVLTFLHGRPRLHRSDKLDLMKQALALFDNPQDKFPTIHVTGTNGKGSTCHLISQLLVAQGYRVGLFTSPFVLKFNERIQIDDQMIPDEQLIALVTEMRPVLAAAQLELTEFEWVTLLMFNYFATQAVDVGVIEVGIGGAHDRTNVINASVGVITSIGLDHQDLIGPTLADIAVEKAGIIKPQQTVIYGELPAAVQPLIAAKIQQQAAKGYQFGQAIQAQHLQWSPPQVQFDWVGADLSAPLRHLRMPALATWQVADASLALAAAAAWLDQRHSQLDARVVRQVLADFQVPGRLEVISQEPLLVLDGAHNIPAITELIATVKRVFAGQPIYLTMGMMADKDIRQVAALLAATNWQVTWTTVADNPRAADQAQLQQQIAAPFTYAATWQQAFQNALQASGGAGVFLFAGSFYLITEVRHYLLAD